MLYASVFLDSLATNGVVPRIHLYHIYGVLSNLYSRYQTASRINYLYQSELYNSAEGICKMVDCLSNRYGLTEQRTVREEHP